MNLIKKLRLELRKNFKRKIVLPEGEDKRILYVAGILSKLDIVDIVLVGNYENIKESEKKLGIDLSKVDIVDPKNFSMLDTYINNYYELRKHKGISLTDAENILKNDYQRLGAMLVREGYADGMVSGAIHKSSDTIKCALEVIGSKNIKEKVSSFFLIELDDKTIGEDGILLYSDCGLIQQPTSDDLVQIAHLSSNSFEKIIGKPSRIAFLSHSTNMSSICPDSEKVRNAVSSFKEKYKDVLADGEMQFDTAIIPEIAKIKFSESKVAGYANTLIFPDLDSGNIAYKITERLAKAKSYGPIIQGLNKPINDLSRGSTIEDIVGVILITAYQSINK